MPKIPVEVLEIEDRIQKWRHEPIGQESEDITELVYLAEDELKRMRDGLKVILHQAKKDVEGGNLGLVWVQNIVQSILGGQTWRLADDGKLVLRTQEDDEEEG